MRTSVLSLLYSIKIYSTYSDWWLLAGLGQSVECLTAEREVASLISGAEPILMIRVLIKK